MHEMDCFLEEHGEVAGDVLAHFGDNLEDARKALEENYNGCYKLSRRLCRGANHRDQRST